MTEEPSSAQRQCFTSIQSRKLAAPLETFELCPSMDLVVFGTSAQQSLYRTVSWQKVANIQPLNETSQRTNCCWSPNGRWIALAHDHHVSLYGVEPLANPPDGGFTSSSGPTESQHAFDLSHPVIALSWMHVGRPHPTAWKISEEEAEEDASWRYQSQYLDRSCDFLPPSAYYKDTGMENQYEQNETATATALPGCKTPLSVLCICTTQNLELYLHGRYLLSKLPRSTDQLPPQLVSSTDLTHLLVYSKPRLSLYHLPFMKKDRYPLQVIASLHSSIMSHLSTIQVSVTEVMNSWKSSLKPLDTKLQPLLGLLKNYGVDDRPLGAILKQYILVGHTSDSSSVANAMDQFFTSVQMNDQLLTRMERSLHGALANVESAARKGLLSPVQALCFQIQELSGLVRFHAKDSNSRVLTTFVRASEQLWLGVEALLTSIISGRFQVRDFCGWLRSAGSQIKAQGTALQSVQRENAKKRRVPHAVLERLLHSLNTHVRLDKQSNITEQLLNITVSEMLKPTATEKPERPPSPSSVAVGLGNVKNVADGADTMAHAAEQFFQNPLSNIPESIVPKEIVLPQFGEDVRTSVAVHTRVGRDPEVALSLDDEHDDVDSNFFMPRIVSVSNPQLPDCLDCRQWAVIAQAHNNSIQLFSIPLGWRDPSEDFEEDATDESIPFYLTAKLVLPMHGCIRQVGFYSDDGKSSLSSGNDSGEGKEGRQKLSVIFQREQPELWLIPYDSLQWHAEPFDPKLIAPQDIDETCWTVVLPAPIGREEDEDDMYIDDGSNVFAQTRTLPGLESNPATKLGLFLCGSRGVGGVSVTNDGNTTLELLDLEEDEESDSEDGDFNDEDE